VKHWIIPTLSEAKSALVLAIGSVVNFATLFDPSAANVWVAFACGILALIIALPKALAALLTLRKQVGTFVKTIQTDCKKLRGK